MNPGHKGCEDEPILPSESGVLNTTPFLNKRAESIATSCDAPTPAAISDEGTHYIVKIRTEVEGLKTLIDAPSFSSLPRSQQRHLRAQHSKQSAHFNDVLENIYYNTTTCIEANDKFFDMIVEMVRHKE